MVSIGLSNISRRRASALAWGLWALVVFLVASALWCAAHGADDGGADGEAVGFVLYIAALIAIPYPTIGALVIARQPGNLVGWLLWAIGFIEAQNVAVDAFARVIDTTYPSLSITLIALCEVSWMPGPVFAVTLLPLLFPTGRPATPRWRWVGWLVAVGLLLTFVPLGAGTWVQREKFANPDRTHEMAAPVEAVVLVGVVVLVCSAAAAVASAFLRLRRARGTEREQVRWFAFGVALALVVSMINMLMPLNVVLGRIVWCGTLVLPAAIGIAILRHRLFDVDLLISRTLLWGLLTAFVIGGYVVVVGVIGARLDGTRDVVPSLVATGLVALLFQPVRARLQRVVDRFVFGDRADPYAAVARLGRRLEATVAADAILPTIVETVAQALKLPYTALMLRQGDGFALAAAHGTPTAGPDLVTVPLTYNAAPVGQLILAPRTPGESFSPADHRLLEDLARQIGVAAHSVRLHDDLQQARERLVTAREEERRRLRRDLHDGLGAQLAALNVQAGVLRNLIDRDPAAAKTATAELRAELRAVIGDVRRLVHGLRPPALDELGLIGALRQRAAQYGTGGNLAQGPGSDAPPLEVAVEADESLPALPAAVEVAVYRVVEEALTNVVRHARARHCTVRLVAVDALDLTITDDGVGIDPGASGGVGLLSMRERAEELGGTCAVEPRAEGGTRVVVRLPLTPRPLQAPTTDG